MAKRLILLIDADDTILDFNRSENEAIIKLCKDYDFCNGKEKEFALDFKKTNRRMWDMFERGEITREQIFYTRFEELFSRYDITGKDIIEIGDAYRENVAMSKCIIYGARTFLASIYKNHDLYCITNGVTRTQKLRLKNTGLGKYFKKLYISQEIGLQKPYKDYFDYVLKDIGDCDIENTYIIGDSLSSDILGGKNSGIKTILFNKENKQIKDIVPDYSVKNYTELKKLIDILSE